MGPNIMLAGISRGSGPFRLLNLRVNCEHDERPPEMSGVGGVADVIDRKADIDFRMSAFGGRADVVCQELSGPFIAKGLNRSRGSLWRQVARSAR